MSTGAVFLDSVIATTELLKNKDSQLTKGEREMRNRKASIFVVVIAALAFASTATPESYDCWECNWLEIGLEACEITQEADTGRDDCEQIVLGPGEVECNLTGTFCAWIDVW
jgi:hypothetical protein